jgi:hypothetical protein
MGKVLWANIAKAFRQPTASHHSSYLFNTHNSEAAEAVSEAAADVEEESVKRSI